MEDQQNSSPVPARQNGPATDEFPTCGICGGAIKAIKYLDYQNVRVVYHDIPMRCVIGVMNPI